MSCRGMPISPRIMLSSAGGRPASSSALLMLRAIAGDESTRTPSRSKRIADPLVTYHEYRADGEERDAEHPRPGDGPLFEAEYPDAVENDRHSELAGDDGGGYAARAEL